MFSLAGRLPSEPSAHDLPSVHTLPRSFATVRLPANVHAGLLVHAPSPAGPLAFTSRALTGSHGSRSRSFHACQGLRPRRVPWLLACSLPPVLPTTIRNCVGTLISEHFAAQW